MKRESWNWLVAAVVAVGIAAGMFWHRGGDINAAPNGKANGAALRIRCGTLDPPENIRRAIRDKLAAAKKNKAAAAALAITVPVQFIHITNGALGHVTEQMRLDQIQVLNDDYAGMGITFTYTAPPIVVDNASWYTMAPGTAAEVACKTTLHVDATTTLNFYTGGLSNGLLGWATFPWDLASDPELDGVVILDESLPGGTADPYNLGRTATHEIGHWLGLYHTFQGGCIGQGDEVSDTVAHAYANYGCPPDARNGACNAAEFAPIHNFMNYTDDACMSEYTIGQETRVGDILPLYRPDLAGGGGGCDCALECMARSAFPFPIPANLLPQFRALRDDLLSQSTDGRRLIRHYYEQSGELYRLLARHPALAIQTGKLLLAALPEDAGTSGRIRISADLYDESQILLAHLISKADPALAEALEDVQSILDRHASLQGDMVLLQFQSPVAEAAAAPE